MSQYFASAFRRRPNDGWFRAGNFSLTTVDLICATAVLTMFVYGILGASTWSELLFAPWLVRDLEIWRLVTWTTATEPDFIQKYIFPGGMLPSNTALEQTFAHAGLRISESYRCGHDYARTLAAWRQRFDAAWPRIRNLGFDARFRRMWHFYLAYCEAGFREGSIDVAQIRLEHA